MGATLGALIAAKENGNTGRVILVVGDGSLHMSVQEIATYIRNGFTPTIFLINNDGYTIEREIWGPEQQYNDISPMWDYQKLFDFFGGRKEGGLRSKSVQARTIEELEAIMTDEEFAKSERIQAGVPSYKLSDAHGLTTPNPIISYVRYSCRNSMCHGCYGGRWTRTRRGIKLLWHS